MTLFDATELTLGGARYSGAAVASSHFGRKDYVLFTRWPGGEGDTNGKGSKGGQAAPGGKAGPAAGVGAMLTARNPFLTAYSSDGKASLSYAPMARLGGGASFAADPAHLGLHTLTNRTLLPPAAALDEAEHAAMVACVRAAMSAPMARRRSVKVNGGTCRRTCTRTAPTHALHSTALHLHRTCTGHAPYMHWACTGYAHCTCQGQRGLVRE